MATQFTSSEWKAVRATLDANPAKYGLPQREYGSVLLGSFNIRKLGSSRSRSPDTWEFLAEVCRSFDLLAVQEIMHDRSGLRRLMSLLGPDFDLIVSDVTGKFPGESGLGERLGFIYRWSAVKRTEVATDITYDRTKVLNTIAERYEEFDEVMAPCAMPEWTRPSTRSDCSATTTGYPRSIRTRRWARTRAGPTTASSSSSGCSAMRYWGNLSIV